MTAALSAALARIEGLAATATKGPWRFVGVMHDKAENVGIPAVASATGWPALCYQSRDAEFIAEMRDAAPRLAAVVWAVLAVHRPTVVAVVDDPACLGEDCGHDGPCPATGTLTICAGCDQTCEEAYAYYYEGNIGAAEYPCATVQAMTKAWEEQR